jgi:mannose-6-phosphate isomerase
MDAYPLKSVPVFKQRIWGGQRLREVFGKDLPPGEKIGESWEMADLPEGRSTIGNGPLCGRTLGEVVRGHRDQIAGTRDFPEQFPLLIKLLDAQDVLSVQVHPDAETCRRMGKGDPKTECWYVIQAEPGAVIYKGFRRGITRERFARAIEDGTAAELLAAVPVKPGECHFVPAGTVHGLGAGLLIAEIQTPSDTTYRVFDWNRADETGKPRQLHVAEALESIHFDITPDKLPVTTVGRLIDSEYFKVDKGIGGAVAATSSHLGEKVGMAYPTIATHGQDAHATLFLARGQMRVLIFLTGGGTIVSNEAGPVDFKAGDCVLIPAAFEGAARFHQDTEYLTVTI